jgi:GMP synthase-like glutamine amidotransferase
MKILLINNNTVHLKALSSALSGHEVEIQRYQPGLDFHHRGKDMVILSGGGGEGHEIDDQHKEGKPWYKDEMSFVRSCRTPLLGICMGFEVMARAHGQKVPKMTKMAYDFQPLVTTEKGWELFSKLQLKQSEAHHWHVPEAPKGFNVLAQSENGVEIIYHEGLRQLGTQFHPEDGGTLSVHQLINSLMAA